MRDGGTECGVGGDTQRIGRNDRVVGMITGRDRLAIGRARRNRQRDRSWGKRRLGRRSPGIRQSHLRPVESNATGNQLGALRSRDRRRIVGLFLASDPAGRLNCVARTVSRQRQIGLGNRRGTGNYRAARGQVILTPRDAEGTEYDLTYEIE